MQTAQGKSPGEPRRRGREHRLGGTSRPSAFATCLLSSTPFQSSSGECRQTGYLAIHSAGTTQFPGNRQRDRHFNKRSVTPLIETSLRKHGVNHVYSIHHCRCCLLVRNVFNVRI